MSDVLTDVLAIFQPALISAGTSITTQIGKTYKSELQNLGVRVVNDASVKAGKKLPSFMRGILLTGQEISTPEKPLPAWVTKLTQPIIDPISVGALAATNERVTRALPVLITSIVLVGVLVFLSGYAVGIRRS